MHAHLCAAFNALWQDWIRIVTGTIAAVLIAIVLALPRVPIGKRYSWLPWVTFIVIWSCTWGWAYVRAWNREHQKVKEFKYWLLLEYVANVSALHRPNILWNKTHEDAITSQINGNKELVRKAIEIVRDGQKLTRPPFLSS